MAVKTAHAKKKMTKRKEVVPVTPLPDVFDEETSVQAKPTMVAETEIEAKPKEAEALPTPRAPRIVTEIEEEKEETKGESVSSEPSFTVRQNGVAVEQKLPSFFVDKESENQAEAVPTNSEMATEQTAGEKALEEAMPQAFVGEVRQVASEVKRERKGTLVTVFIVLGMILVAGGIVGLFFLNTKRQNGSAQTSAATPVVEATPEPTPTVIVTTASASASLVTEEMKQGIKVNVLNGTTIKGLAAKEAAIIKKNGYTLGTVGNGDPASAGKIVVPTGKLDLGEDIKALLPDITLSVSEDAKATTITVTLGEPSQ